MFNNNQVSQMNMKNDLERNQQKVLFMDVKPVASPGDRQHTPAAPTINLGLFKNPQRDVVYENIKPVLYVLRMLGAFPYSHPRIGRTELSLTSPASIYSCLLVCVMFGYVGYICMHRVRIVSSAEAKFEEAVISYLFTIYLFPIVILLIMWYEARKIVAVLNGWADFEIHFKQISKRPLPLTLKRKSFAIALIIPTLSTTSVFITHATMVHFRIVQVLPYAFLEVLTYLLGGYWYLLCEVLSSSATILADDFQQALKHIGPASMVAEYRALWLRLSRLARDTGIANTYTFTFISLYLFLIITLSIYGLMSQISEGFGIKDIGLTVTAFCSIFLLFFICDEAHYASHNVRTNFQKKLLMVELSWMNSDAQTEITMFLRATEMNPSAISLGGFFDVNRNLFKSLLATMVTYLVVLLQFQISLPENRIINGGNSTLQDDNADDNYDY